MGALSFRETTAMKLLSPKTVFWAVLLAVALKTGPACLHSIYSAITPKAELAGDPANWGAWPLFLVPFAIVGTLLAVRIWNAAPRKKAAPALAEAPAES